MAWQDGARHERGRSIVTIAEGVEQGRREPWIAGPGSRVGGRRSTADYDAEAATYDENPYPDEMQRASSTGCSRPAPPGGIVLDAPCGSGQYFARVVASAGRRIVGIDQSAGMLEQARARGIAGAAAPGGPAGARVRARVRRRR